MDALPIDANGRFAGYASVFHKVDEGGDIVLPGAFRKSLGLRGKHRIKMLFQHDPKDPVGTWDTIREDDFGLYVEGRLVGEVPRADVAAVLSAVMDDRRTLGRQWNLVGGDLSIADAIDQATSA